MSEVYKCIAAVAAEMAKDGISKSRKNETQGYKFRGIDEVLNALAPALVQHGLVILPRFLTRAITERATAKGGILFCVVVEAEFDFVAVSDGSLHTVRTFGEAMDSADKATNKAMSAAYKYAAFQAFCIPTEGDNDADAHSPQPVAAKTVVKTQGVLSTKASIPAPDADYKHIQRITSPLISEAQQKRLWAISKAKGWSQEQLKELLFIHRFTSTKDITKAAYTAICETIEKAPQAPRLQPNEVFGAPEGIGMPSDDDIFTKGFK